MNPFTDVVNKFTNAMKLNFANLRLALAFVALATTLLLVLAQWGPAPIDRENQTLSPTFLLAFAGLAWLTFACFTGFVAPRFEAVDVVPNRVRDALNTFTEGLLLIDEQERIVLANDAFAQMIEQQPNRLLGKRASRLRWVCSHDAGIHDFPWMRVLDHHESGKPLGDHSSEQLLRYQMRNGQLRFMAVTAARVRSARDQSRGVLATFRDVTHVEEERADMERMLAVLRANRKEISDRNRELEKLASHDALTDCFNRRSFMAQLHHSFDAAIGRSGSLSCLMFDNDHFKNVNDTYGHSVGDEVLRRVSRTLKDAFDDEGLVCRYGGEEFCVALPGVALEEASQKAEAARKSIEAIRLDNPAELRLTASIGVTDLTFKAPSPQAMIDQADKCLYAAKSQGRNQVVVFNDEIDRLSIDSLKARHTPTSLPELSQEIPFHAAMGLVSALAYRDTATASHCRRVANLCVTAAARLLDQRSTYVLEMAALLHDIGKIALPDDILQKPGPLTPDQWRLIAKHHRIGVEIVSGTFHNAELCEIVRTHPAYYGGRSLIADMPSGKKIPLAARLLTIADTYDVIVTDRPHRKGRSHDEAVAELRRCAGKQFDPILVEHFIATLQSCPESSNTRQSVSRQTALQIGLQIEHLAEAIDNRNLGELQQLASRLIAMAQHHSLDDIVETSERLQDMAAEPQVRWLRILETTQKLLGLCRSTQSAFVNDPSDPPPPGDDNEMVDPATSTFGADQ
ncbi:sensor domain-containing diguanylate cyclase/phosphohydrolase [Crateriforma conspicua]|uniref:diguanylate cyclase n=1 Tax=Crateriforma conspicua TaxID=2527996 RepID=A0A5C5YCD5_9PLAN|nr:diguanylate cyclase [Crateriforma conspicua]TWT72588.1 Cyclic di-GMP phosphodiesterase response regulator RpfG [Crateriforma conspicua]